MLPKELTIYFLKKLVRLDLRTTIKKGQWITPYKIDINVGWILILLQKKHELQLT